MTNMQYMYINSAHLITHLQSVYLLQDYFQHSKALKKKASDNNQKNVLPSPKNAQCQGPGQSKFNSTQQQVV